MNLHDRKGWFPMGWLFSWLFSLLAGFLLILGGAGPVSADMTVSPAAINLGTLTLAPGASSDYAFTIAVSDQAGAPPATGFVASANVFWLQLSAGTGAIPGSLTATVEVSAAMTAGAYSGNIVISSEDTVETETIPVTFTLVRAITGQLTVSPATLEVVIPALGSSQQTFPVLIENTDPATTAFTWSAQSNAEWLTLSESSGTGNATISVTINPDNMMLSGGATTLTGKVTVRSSLNAAVAELTVTVRFVLSTEVSAFPSQLFWTVEKSPDQEGGLAADAFPAQTIQMYSGAFGWSVTHDLTFATVEGDLISLASAGELTVTPNASILNGWGYGRHEGTITVTDRTGSIIRIPVTVEVRHPGELSRVSSYFNLVEVAESGLLNLELQLPRTLAYYPSATLCQAAGGNWLDPDGRPGNLDEYCSLNQRAYILITLPEMFPGQILALTPKVSDGIILVARQGIFLSGTDSYSYTDGPIPFVTLGPWQLNGFKGTCVISVRVGATLAAAVETQRIQVNIRNLTGSWRMSELYQGELYNYGYDNLLALTLSSATGGYSGSWGGTPVTVTPGDGYTHLYRITMSENYYGHQFDYTYEVLSLTGNEMVGRWRYSWGNGVSEWETFLGQRVIQPFIRY